MFPSSRTIARKSEVRSLIIGLIIAMFVHVASINVNAQDPKPRDEIRKELDEQKKKLDAILQDILDDHLKAVREAEKAAIEELKALARMEAGSGKIREATEAWTEVIKLDSTDADANKFFKAIGREDIIQQEIAKAIERQSPEPSKRNEWQSEGNSVYRRLPNGSWLHIWQDKDGLHQRTMVEVGRTPYFIELFHDAGSFKQYKRIYGDRLFWRYANEKDWVDQIRGQWTK